MTKYSNAQGAMSHDDIAKRVKALKQFFTNNKSAATRASAVIILPQMKGTCPLEYVARFDRANNLKECAYTWQAEPQAHYNVPDMPVTVEYETDAAVSFQDYCTLEQGRERMLRAA